jgi:hypothetical protein
MTKFVFQGTGETVGDGGIKKIGAAALVVGAGVVAYKALGSAASTLGELVVIVPLTLGSLAVGAVVTYVVLRAHRRRQPAAVGRPAAAVLWQANPQASPLLSREARAIAPAPVVNVNIDAGLLAGLLRASQQQPSPVFVQSEAQELPR